MSVESLLLAAALPALLSLAVIGFLRPILLPLLTEECGSAGRARFWLRCAGLLALLGSTGLVLVFALPFHGSWVESLRQILIFTIGGLFLGVAWIARAVWRFIPPPRSGEPS